MNARPFVVVLSLVSALAGCAASSSSSDEGAASDDQALAAAAVSPIANGHALSNSSFQVLRALYDGTQYSYQSLSNSSAFAFAPAAAMSDADALGIAKSVARSAGYSSLHAYVVNAQSTPSRLARVANSLATNIGAQGDDANTPKLLAAFTKAFSSAGSTPGGAIHVFSAIGPGDDHDWDNIDREAIFVDAKSGEVLVLQGQTIDM